MKKIIILVLITISFVGYYIVGLHKSQEIFNEVESTEMVIEFVNDEVAHIVDSVALIKQRASELLAIDSIPLDGVTIDSLSLHIYSYEGYEKYNYLINVNDCTIKIDVAGLFKGSDRLKLESTDSIKALIKEINYYISSDYNEYGGSSPSSDLIYEVHINGKSIKTDAISRLKGDNYKTIALHQLINKLISLPSIRINPNDRYMKLQRDRYNHSYDNKDNIMKFAYTFNHPKNLGYLVDICNNNAIITLGDIIITDDNIDIINSTMIASMQVKLTNSEVAKLNSDFKALDTLKINDSSIIPQIQADIIALIPSLESLYIKTENNFIVYRDGYSDKSIGNEQLNNIKEFVQSLKWRKACASN
ncbi:MAG: hypothetical protein R3Y22_09165 [Bacteroidales bacterium]